MRTRIARPLLAATLALTVLVVAAGLAACGVPMDDEPRPITQTTLEPALTTDTPTTVASDGAAEVGAYFLRGDRLERVAYPVAEVPTLGRALAFVLANPAEDGDPALRTAIPPGTAARSAYVDGAIAWIDLTDEIDDVSGQPQKEAFAQLVFTALDLGAADRVRFSVDGKEIDAPTDRGNLREVTADDYDPPLNPR